MLAFLLTNWKSIAAVAATALLAFLLHTVDVNRLKADEREAVANQKTADSNQCNAEKQVTKEATDALQKDRDNLNTKLSALKLQHPATCVPVTSSSDILNRNGRPARRYGISSDWLYDYAANQCSSYWRQLKVCDKFLDDERKIKP